MPHLIYTLFFFILGACVGSFLNVAVGRFPWDDDDPRWFPWLRALSSPPSHCPKCQHPLAWYDNIPVFGWFLLRGKCRYCTQPISFRYPTIEALTGALFAFYYVMFFILHIGPPAPEAMATGVDLFNRQTYAPIFPTTIADDWPLYAMVAFLIASLIVVTLIDMEFFMIPLSLPWLMALVGCVGHALTDTRHTPGALCVPARGPYALLGALAAGGAAGLLVSIALHRVGWLRPSFADGEPLLEIDREAHAQEVQLAKAEGRDPPPEPRLYTRAEIRREISQEMIFLMPPMVGAIAWGLLTTRVNPLRDAWVPLLKIDWFSGLLGAMLGALIGALFVWLARILGTLGFGKVAMGLGDVHLMFGVGAIIGAGPAVLAFFLAPFAGLVYGLYRVVSRGKWELPFGPYLSLASAAVLLIYAPVADYLAPGFAGLLLWITSASQ